MSSTHDPEPSVHETRMYLGGLWAVIACILGIVIGAYLDPVIAVAVAILSVPLFVGGLYVLGLWAQAILSLFNSDDDQEACR